jgi:WD40 repeat protein
LVWSAADGSILYSKDEIILQPQYTVFSPDGQYFVASTLEPSIYIWRVDTGELFMRPTGLSNVRSIAYSVDGRFLAAGSSNFSNETGEPLARTIIWDASTFEILVRTDRTIASLDLSFSPDASLLVSSKEQGDILIWNAGDGSLLRTLGELSARSWSNAFSPDGTRIAAGSTAGEIVIWGIPGE